MASVLLLGLIFAAGVTGYSLPWDARAFFGTRVTEGIAGGLPFIGSTAPNSPPPPVQRAADTY